MQRFREVGLEPDSRHGQNFLIDLNLIELLARSAQIDGRDVVLEVGTGTGSLTAMLAEHAQQVVTVEIDAHLHQIASQTLVERSNVTMLLQDVLRNKNNLHPVVLDTLREKLAAEPGLRLKLAANLPYNVATPIISNLLLTDMPPYSMTITIQKELGDRLVAEPWSKDYGALSVWIQSQCDVEIVRILPPQVFWPRPKVHSAIVHMQLVPERRAAIPDLKFFHTFVRSMFFHRRKFLRSVMIAAFKNQFEKPQIDQIMTQQSLGADARAEQLSVEQMLSLCEACRTMLKAQEAEE
ncbi:Ribosomal RNA adenine dimethylase [Lignipirellula cremea]|uniref:Ribosomal RNA small subunit methyltransferase A n=2 Tax=Lignipirellula cremea TaxID=2528010 RepID=A0A518DWT6_9BACT|nr:Ribosomal RNA adenine dimethylase [Lignipirellula cremea]